MNPPRTVVTMARCWYTRAHHPLGALRSSRDGGVFHARCRHCHREIASADRLHWDIAGGIRADARGPRARACLSVVDVLDEMVIARFPIGDLADEAVQALRARIRRDYRLDDPAATLVLRDSRQRDDGWPPALSRRVPMAVAR